MKKIRIRICTVTALLSRVISFSLAITFTGLALADPPMRVARLGYLSGGVSFSPAGESDWVAGTLNRPLVTGDRLWANERGRVELQIGNAVVRLGARTLFTLTNLDDRIAQMNLQDGTLNLRVRRLERGQVIEVDTPNLALVIRQAGEYRVTVDAARDSTEVRTRSGRADVFGKGASYAIGLGRAYRFFGAGLVDFDVLTLPRADEFDRWGQARDSRYDTSVSARYVSRDVIGYQDLDQYGSWRSVPEYGNVWTPTRVAANWAPYRDGHWSWVEPWGWTWVDDLPWGFAVSHYGRWINNDGRWGWIPGPTTARAVYAPALVAFVGGSNFQLSASSGSGGAVGWFPLGPREVYRPAYAVSREYFTNVNISNTVINNTTIINNYDNRNSTTVLANTVYVNQRVPGAVVAVPTAAFVQSQPVARAATHVSEAAVMAATITTLAAIAPTSISVRGAAAQRSLPPAAVAQPRFVAQSPPPAAAVGFTVRERALAANPGKPVDTAALVALKPAAPIVAGAVLAAPRVEIVPETRPASAAVVAPPMRAPSDRTRNREQPPVAAPQPAQPTQPAQPAQTAQPPPTPTPAAAPVAAQLPPAARPPGAPPQETTKPGNRTRELRDTPAAASPLPTAPPPPARGIPAAQPQPSPASTPTPTPSQAGERPSPAAPQQGRDRGRRPSEPLAQPLTPAPVPGDPAAITQPPRPGNSGNVARERREAPGTAVPVPVAPAPLASVPPPARPARPVTAPVPTIVGPEERSPAPAQRGRVEPAPVLKPPTAPSTTPPPAAAQARPAEVVGPTNPPPRSTRGDKKPDGADEKKGGRKDDKDDKNDTADDEGKRPPEDKEKKRK